MKFFPPLGQGVVHRITQTYHSSYESQVQTDISSGVDKPVYAVADGVITKATPVRGSYCVQDIGLPYQVLYLHTYKWLPVGTKVKRGQVIARVAPTSLNGGYPTHLDLCIQNKDGTKPQVGLMELVDRSTTFGVGFAKGSANYNAILKAWFVSDIKINWSLFADIDPFDTPQKGDRYEYLRDTNVRTAPKVSAGINGLAKQGAVGEVVTSGSWFADGYEWIFLNLHTIEGYSIKKNVIRTNKSKTTPDGNSIVPPVVVTPPTVPPTDPCKALVEAAVVKERAKWEAKIKELLTTIELYKKEEVEQKNLVAKLLERFRG